MSALHGSRVHPAVRVVVAWLLATLMATAGVAAEAEKSEKKAAESQAELEQKLAAARQRLDAAAREVAELSMSLSEDAMPHFQPFGVTRPQRAMIGIMLGSGAKLDDGVEVVGVSPGGPAADAGIKSGDVLLEANGHALKRDGAASSRDVLMGVLHEAKPGDKISVSYRRDGKVAKATLTAKPLADQFFTMAIPGPGMVSGTIGTPPIGVRSFGHFPDFAFMRADGVFGSAELVPLTPKLGQYFGTEKGLLVVRAPADSRLKLEDGDVIVDIDGRTPSSPSHALRILGSYQPGEKLQLNVLRAKKKLSFDITIPEGSWERRVGGVQWEDGGAIHHKMGPPNVIINPAVPLPPGPGTIRTMPYPPANATPIVPPLPDEEA